MAVKPSKINRAGKHLGQLQPPETRAAPTETPEIVERFMGVVGKAVKSLEDVQNFTSREINAVAALGRAVAQLQLIEATKGSLGPGEKPLESMTNEEIRQRLQLQAAKREITNIVEAKFEEAPDDNE